MDETQTADCNYDSWASVFNIINRYCTDTINLLNSDVFDANAKIMVKCNLDTLVCNARNLIRKEAKSLLSYIACMNKKRYHVSIDDLMRFHKSCMGIIKLSAEDNKTVEPQCLINIVETIADCFNDLKPIVDKIDNLNTKESSVIENGEYITSILYSLLYMNASICSFFNYSAFSSAKIFNIPITENTTEKREQLADVFEYMGSYINNTYNKASILLDNVNNKYKSYSTSPLNILELEESIRVVNGNYNKLFSKLFLEWQRSNSNNTFSNLNCQLEMFYESCMSDETNKLLIKSHEDTNNNLISNIDCMLKSMNKWANDSLGLFKDYITTMDIMNTITQLTPTLQRLKLSEDNVVVVDIETIDNDCRIVESLIDKVKAKLLSNSCELEDCDKYINLIRNSIRIINVVELDLPNIISLNELATSITNILNSHIIEDIYESYILILSKYMDKRELLYKETDTKKLELMQSILILQQTLWRARIYYYIEYIKDGIVRIKEKIINKTKEAGEE